MKYRKEIEFELTNKEIGDLLYAGGNLATTANILNNFVDGAANVLKSDVMADVIAAHLDPPTREFFKELANDIKIREAQEEEEEEEEPMCEEVPEPEDSLQKCLVADLCYTLTNLKRDEQLEKVKELVDRGVNINYRPPYNKTNFSAAYICALFELTEVLKYLISVGLDISIPCSMSQGEDTAIVYARRSDKKEIIEILEDAERWQLAGTTLAPIDQEEPEKEKEEEETFYHVGQLFNFEDEYVYKIISHNGKADAIRFQKIHDNYYVWFNSYSCFTTDVINPDKITKSEFKVITDNYSSAFTPITQEEADKIIAASK